ncbi:MAG: serine/threonine protein kinase, partial [Reichenbachiella sp.]
MDFIGKYKIIKELGAGGFGAVYLTQDPKLNELVAIKVFQIKDDNLAKLATSATFDASEVLNQRFLNEARTLRQLGRNRHIVNVFDFDELDDGRPYYVMPYLPKSLKDELGSDATDSSVIADLPSDEKPRPIPVSQALVHLSQLLNALSDVHKAGLVHRDIKPANLLLNEDNDIQLCDFGIAKMPDVQHSQSGIGMGSRNYMAPEQRQSAKHVDARSDIYSVGVLAYRMITGTLPEGRFAEPNIFQPNLAQSLNDLILKALEQKKENRFQDAAQMLKALNKAQQAQQNQANTQANTQANS